MEQIRIESIKLAEEREELRIKLAEEREEKRQKEQEYWNHSTYNNEKCDICNINKCKCKSPFIIKDNYNRNLCSNCNKLICECVRITDFFKTL